MEHGQKGRHNDEKHFTALILHEGQAVPLKTPQVATSPSPARAPATDDFNRLHVLMFDQEAPNRAAPPKTPGGSLGRRVKPVTPSLPKLHRAEAPPAQKGRHHEFCKAGRDS